MSSDEMFNVIFERFKPLIRVIARGYRVPTADIDDIVQEVFLAFYRAYPLDLPEEECRRLLTEIANNRCIDYLRKLKTHPEFSCDPVILQEELRAKDCYHGDGLTLIIEKQKYKQIVSALKSMKPEWADVFWLRVIEGKTSAETSALLGISDTACRKRLQRSREYLRRYMKRQEAEESKRKSGQRKPAPAVETPRGSCTLVSDNN